MTIDELNTPFYAEVARAKAEYKGALEMHLAERKLNGGVVRLKDGVKGRLYVASDHFRGLTWGVKFYPLNKDGTVSEKASGYIDEYKDLLEQFQPVEVDE